MIVVCPCGCNHRFSAQPNWPEYEKLVAELCGGFIEPSGKNGYDVLGPDGIRYQVKMANEKKSQWAWMGRFPNDGADFYVLFRIDYQGKDYMYILPEKQWHILGKPDRKSDFFLKVRIRTLYKIAEYQCEINKYSFRARVSQLMCCADTKTLQSISFQLMLGIE